MSYAEHATLPAFARADWVDGKVTNKGDLPLWSNRTGECFDPPAIGTRVNCIINSCGPATVIGYFTQDGWLGVRVGPLENPPEWFLKQNKGNVASGVFGTEIKLIPADPPKLRIQTVWETRQSQVDLIGRSVEVPGPDGFGQGGGYGDIIAFRKTSQGPQVKVRRLYGQGEVVHFLKDVRASGIPEAIAEQF